MAASIPMVGNMAKAETVTLDALSGVYPGNGGGEFTAYTSQNFLPNYASAATYAGGFETFCIETGVEFSPGNTYYYTISQNAQPISPPKQSSGSGWPLSYGAAYLYYEFGKGALGGFDYAYGAGRMADDNLLQAAIWAFQGGQTYNTGVYGNGITGNPFYSEAVSALTALSLDPNGAYIGTQVEVLNMWVDSGDTIAAQNQLVLPGGSGPLPHPSVPDGGMTVMLLGGALVGLATMRRKLFF